MTRRKEQSHHPAVGSGRTGVAIADMQTFHYGHHVLLSRMRAICDVSIVALGSVKRFNEPGHPFTFEQRKAMIEAVHGDAFRFVQLDDIDASRDMRAWYDYVQRKIVNAGLPDPTDCFSGSRIDARWYFDAFASEAHPRAEATGIAVHTHPDTGRRLHLIDRAAGGLPSGREIRLLIETRSDEWRAYVPERIHRFIELEYPPQLRQPIDYDRAWEKASKQTRRDIVMATDAFANKDACSPVGHLESAASVMLNYREGVFTVILKGLGYETPVGTRLTGQSISSSLLELKDDGVWRPLGPSEDEKARWARDQARA